MAFKGGAACFALVVAICSRCDGATLSGTIKSLQGTALTIAELNAVRARVGQPQITAREYRLSLRIAATPRGSRSSVGTITFDAATGAYSIDVPTVDPDDKRIDIRLSAPGLLQPVILEGVSIETQPVNVIMPIQHHGCCRYRYRCRR